jgi:hypothetical protein
MDAGCQYKSLPTLGSDRSLFFLLYSPAGCTVCFQTYTVLSDLTVNAVLDQSTYSRICPSTTLRQINMSTTLLHLLTDLLWFDTGDGNFSEDY